MEIEALVINWHNVAAQPEIAERRKVVKGAIDAEYFQTVLTYDWSLQKGINRTASYAFIIQLIGLLPKR